VRGRAAEYAKPTVVDHQAPGVRDDRAEPRPRRDLQDSQTLFGVGVVVRQHGDRYGAVMIACRISAHAVSVTPRVSPAILDLYRLHIYARRRQNPRIFGRRLDDRPEPIPTPAARSGCTERRDGRPSARARIHRSPRKLRS
jgi:hypothetical protein